MEDNSIVINLGKKSNGKILNDNPLKDYIEIKAKYLNLFFGNWIKIINKTTKEYNSGGILTELNVFYKSAYFRNLNGYENVLRLYPIDNFHYFVKKDSEHYRAYLNIISEYEKIKHMKQKIT